MIEDVYKRSSQAHKGLVVLENTYPILSSGFRKRKPIEDIDKPISSGFLELDEILSGGFRRGELVLITGSAGSGKGILSKTLAENMASEYSVGFSSYVGKASMMNNRSNLSFYLRGICDEREHVFNLDLLDF